MLRRIRSLGALALAVHAIAALAFAAPLLAQAITSVMSAGEHADLEYRDRLERQREYYSEVAMTQAENALSRILQEIEQLCQRDDACEVVGQLLRQLDAVTKLSAWTEPQNLH